MLFIQFRVIEGQSDIVQIHRHPNGIARRQRFPGRRNLPEGTNAVYNPNGSRSGMFDEPGNEPFIVGWMLQRMHAYQIELLSVREVSIQRLGQRDSGMKRKLFIAGNYLCRPLRYRNIRFHTGKPGRPAPAVQIEGRDTPCRTDFQYGLGSKPVGETEQQPPRLDRDGVAPGQLFRREPVLQLFLLYALYIVITVIQAFLLYYFGYQIKGKRRMHAESPAIPQPANRF